MNLTDTAIMTTACWRPYYLEETLNAWARTRGINEVQRFCVALGVSNRLEEAKAVITEFEKKVQIPVEVYIDDPRIGPWAAIGTMIARIFENPETGFMICNDEDTYVAEDVLELYSWGRAKYEDDKRVLVVNAHSKCGQGWDGPTVKDDPEADPAVVRLIPYFNAWGWATWRDRWENALKPTWDYNGTSGGAMDSGCDWNIAARVIPNGDYLAVTPDASRTQHIGWREGMFSNDTTLPWSQAASFQEKREAVTFRVEPGGG